MGGAFGATRDSGLEQYGEALSAAGYDVLLFDLRGHGQSDPSRLYLGRRERADIRAVMAWAGAEGFTHDRIGWLGYSMGGSTLLMEAARNPQIQVAVIDSPYGDLPKLLEVQLSRHSGLPSWFNPGILLAARWIFGGISGRFGPGLLGLVHWENALRYSRR